MKLKYVQIENFRSINDVEIRFSPSFRILVGKNESGKSNILDALAMLSDNFTPAPEDVREPLPNENPIENAFIRFVFELTLEQRQKIFDELVSEIHPDDVELPILTKSKKPYTLHDFCIDRSEYLFKVNLKASSDSRQNSYWAIPSSFKIVTGWKKPKEGNTTEFAKYSLIHEKRIDVDKTDQFQNVSAEDINKIVGQKIIEMHKSFIPDVLFWKYDEANILPPSVDLAAFAANPQSCIPLKNMFSLAGVSDIQKETTEAQQGSPNQLRNLLNRVANHSTSYLRQIWQENKGVEFCLEPNGPNIDITIKENNRYSFSQRSDGFKRFVTFLLMISTSCATDDLTDCLILIDEPENGIHPSGVRYLRDELKKISNKNYVVVATHSIFMVDEDNIERHYIVTKKEEKSSVHMPDEHNLAEEEVIYRALGFSIYEILNDQNIIFEGWYDKRLFKIAMKDLRRGFAPLRPVFQGIGVSHCNGVKHIKNITPVFEFTNRKCIIVSDADKMAREKQKEYKKQKGYGHWKRYDEIDDACTAVTGEDFIKNTIVNQAIKVTQKKYANLTQPLTLSNPNPKGKIFAIKTWLKGCGLNTEQVKNIVHEIKGFIFEKLKPSDIETSYYEFLSKLAQQLQQTKDS